MKPAFTPAARPQPVSALLHVALPHHAALANPDQPMTADHASEVLTFAELAYLNLVQGSGSAESWSCIAMSANLAMILAEMDVGEDQLEALDTAIGAIFQAQARGERTGRWGFTGDAMKKVRHMLDVYAWQLKAATRAEVLHARDTMMKRLAKGHVYRLAAA